MDIYQNFELDPPKRKVGRPRNTDEKICSRCCTENSCEWRRGPDNCYLCNSCGLQFNKLSVVLSFIKTDTKFLVVSNPFPIIYQAFLLRIFSHHNHYKALMNEVINAQYIYGDNFVLDLDRYLLIVNETNFNFKPKDKQ